MLQIYVVGCVEFQTDDVNEKPVAVSLLAFLLCIVFFKTRFPLSTIMLYTRRQSVGQPRLSYAERRQVRKVRAPWKYGAG
ncbi:hypothetical protein CES85_1580 [Ochrobactrum quorumnocens]|uniref:Uncharacterized protein n=1 Tax=Ochrobactrum quorumnocens TaxID=271865 RepID=A0A248UHY1_9HYPH|nr:hypothetical protein CES85_1580 [[Ochrobactrum] quorumnocens]